MTAHRLMKRPAKSATGVYHILHGGVSGRAELDAWLRLHGIEPHLVPHHGARVVVGGGRLTIDVYLTRDGHKYQLPPPANGVMARGTMQVPFEDGLPLPACLKAERSIPINANGGIRT